MRILLADGDEERAKRLAEVLVAHEHSVELAPHGPMALELALERQPKLIVCAIDLPLIDGVRLTEILRGNPRTRSVAMLFLVEDELDAPVGMELRDRIALAPWDPEDVAALVDTLGGRDVPRVEESSTDIEGELSQISLADLLQVFHANRKSGAIRIGREGGGDNIALRDGQVVEASAGSGHGPRATGEKALFRLLGLRSGRFQFVPDATPLVGSISRPTRGLLLEAARQLDEWERHRSELPAPEARLRAVRPAQAAAAEDHPLTAAVFEAVARHGRVADVVDHVPFPDYQVLRALHDLIGQEALELELPAAGVDERARPAVDGIFTSIQVRRLREWMAVQRPRPDNAAKVLVVPADRAAAQAFAAALRECPDFCPAQREPGAEPLPGVGSLGYFPLGEDLKLRLLLVSPELHYEPLWPVAAYGKLGAVVVLREPLDAGLAATRSLTAALRRWSRRPVLHLVLTADGEAALPEAGRQTLQRENGGPLFALPEAAGPVRRPILQNLFARLAP